MEHFEFIVEPYLSGVRIDTFLHRHLRNFTPWRLHRMVTEGLAGIDGLMADETQRVFAGQTVSIRLVEPPDKLLEPEAADLEIVYEDPWIIVVNKPVGLVAHPVGNFQEGTLSNILQHHFDKLTKARGLLRPGVVHRLDRMTSGLIVVTKEHQSHRRLSEDFQRGRNAKSYLAIVVGQPDFEDRVIDLPIGQRPGNNSVLMSAQANARRPRVARTDVHIVQRFEKSTLVECRLHTGRNHQIRVHLAEIGHPVVGDEFYGPRGSLRPSAKLNQSEPTDSRHALHACRLGFSHPILNVWMEFTAPPPRDFWLTSDDLL